MTDNKEKNIQPLPSGDPSLDPLSTPSSEVKPEQKAEKFVSAGKRIHNEITYRGVDWILNSSIGVAFTQFVERNPTGQRFFGQYVTGAFKKGLAPILKGQNLEEGAKWGGRLITILAGGTAIIPIMMGLENKKVKKDIVRGLDEKIYGKETVESDPKFQESYDRIDQEAKKGFMAGMSARALAITPLLVIASFPVLNRPFDKYLYTPLAKITRGVAEKIGIRPKGMMSKGVVEFVELENKKRFVSDWESLHHTVGFDFGLTIFYSVMHEAAYKAIARFVGNNKKGSLDNNSPKQVAELSKEKEDFTPEQETPACFSKAICPKKALEAPPHGHVDKLLQQASNQQEMVASL